MTPYTLAFLVDSVPFTPDVVAGRASLGGSESACLGLARALRARGHHVHIFATKLAPEVAGVDACGVTWHPFEQFGLMQQYVEWDVVVALRSWPAFTQARINARLRVLWNQDLLVPGPMVQGVMAAAFQIDALAYVSGYHRQQWEHILPEVTPLGWVTRNGFDPAHVPTRVTKDPNRIIHISRPERGMGPILAMWPALKQVHPEATLRLCRYSSMYDTGKGSWSDVCAQYDAEVRRVNAAVGGITYLGELGKADLYREIAEAAVMWYPGVAAFAETSCIAAIEAQACGTPFVGSYKGALVETATPALDAGHLIRGDAERDQAYHTASITAVVSLLRACGSDAYTALQEAGRAHVAGYTYEALAASWEAQIGEWFRVRFEADRPGVLRALVHEDDFLAARELAAEINDGETAAFAARVIAGQDHTAEDYGAHAYADPAWEAEHSGRFAAVVRQFAEAGASSVLDVACGNGSFALALCAALPAVHVVGMDWSAANIARARTAAEQAGIADRATFLHLPVYDFDTHTITPVCRDYLANHARTFDGLFCGEFVEHVAAYQAVIDALDGAVREGGLVVYTCPSGNCLELITRRTPVHRGHVSRFAHDDVAAVWGPKRDFEASYLPAGQTFHGKPFGNWLITYRAAEGWPAGARPIADRIRRTRPYARLSVGLIVKDAAADLARCLESVWPIADEIVVGDTGSTDETQAIAEAFGARVLHLTPIPQDPDGFSGARNAVLQACTGEWFLWIDADEVLTSTETLRPYLDTVLYRGYVLRQHHVSVDLPTFYDRPVRVFRRDGVIQFYGCIHEQPGSGDANTDITPCLELTDGPSLLHTGYTTAAIRSAKMFQRNLPLLVRDTQRFPDRRLGKVLVLRDYVNIAAQDRAEQGGRMTPTAQQCYRAAIALWDAHFTSPADPLHALARPWYEQAIQALGLGWEFEFSLGGSLGGLHGTATPTRVWVRSAEEVHALMDAAYTTVREGMRAPDLHPDPFEEVARV